MDIGGATREGKGEGVKGRGGKGRTGRGCAVLKNSLKTLTSVCKSGYPLSGYPDLSANFMTAAENPDILK